MDRKHGTIIDNATVSNNQSDTTILHCHNHTNLKLFGETTNNIDLVVVGSNRENSADWYKVGTLVKSASHLTNNVFDTNSFDLVCDIVNPPPYIKIGNISGTNATGTTIHYTLH